MRKRGPISIGNESFPTITAAKERIRHILHGTAKNSFLEGEDLALMLALIERHPSAAEKKGCGIKGVLVCDQMGYPTPGFWIKREDGTACDFSYLKCLETKSTLQDFMHACRLVVKWDAIAFRDAYFAGRALAPCQVSGQMIQKEGAHVDHIAPNTFQNIVLDFIRELAIDVNGVEYVSGDGHLGSEFASETLRASFLDFHRKKASLRVISAHENLSLGGKASRQH